MKWRKLNRNCIESEAYVISKAWGQRHGRMVWVYRAWPKGGGAEYVAPLCEALDADTCKQSVRMYEQQTMPKRGR